MTFNLVDPTRDAPRRPESLKRRRPPSDVMRLDLAAPRYQPDAPLVDAINTALSLGVPLLLTGEPGTGKTQVAYYLAWYFGLEAGGFFKLSVRSTTTHRDLLYEFDAVRYLHAAYVAKESGVGLDKQTFLEKRPLWQAFERLEPSIVLIDEIDKAPRDFPNDLLGVIDQHEFDVAEIADHPPVKNASAQPPAVIITSNGERRLPEPFLRRCVFHHIALTDDLLRRAVAAHKSSFASLGAEVVDEAIRRFKEIRRSDLRKKPATGELIAWLVVLSARGGVGLETIRDARADELPAISVLVKDREDLAALR